MLYQELYDKVLEVLSKYETVIVPFQGNPFCAVTKSKFEDLAKDIAAYICLED
jgi:hypothetical protein